MHQIGVGVLGPVYRTYDPDNDRLVAVKAFHLDLIPEQLQSLVDELRCVLEAGLSHPGIVTPLDVGLENGIPYLAQEYVAAESLDVVMHRHAPVSTGQALRFITQLATAVDAAHERGVVHGGLHLRDVFVTPEDEVRVNGFGVATALNVVEMRAPIRRPYTAPEIIAGRALGPEADRFSVAAIAYELLTGKRAAGTGEQVIERLNDVIGVSDTEALQSLFTSALADDPAMRDTTTAEFLSVFEGAVGLSVTATSTVAVASRTQAATDSVRTDNLLVDPPPDSRTDDTDSDDVSSVDSELGSGLSAESINVSGGTSPADEIEATDLVVAPPLDSRTDDTDSDDVSSVDSELGSGLSAESINVSGGTPPADEIEATDLAVRDRLEQLPDISHDAEKSLARDSSTADDTREPWLPLSVDDERPAVGALNNNLEWDLSSPAGSDAVRETEITSTESFANSRGEPVIVPQTHERPVETNRLEMPDLLEAIEPGPGLVQESVEEVEPSRVRVVLPMVFAVAVGILAAYFVGLGLGSDVQLLDADAPAQVTGQRLENNEPVPAGSDGIETPGGLGANGQVVSDAVPASLGAQPDIQPRMTEARSEVVPPVASFPPPESVLSTTEHVVEAEPPRSIPGGQFVPNVELAPPEEANALRDAGTGWLLVRTDPPGADVSIDGVNRGQTPLSLRDVGYGTHRLEVSAVGYASHVREVMLSDEASIAAVRVQLAAADAASSTDVGNVGSIVVDSRPPGSRVLIDGRVVGVTPVLVPDLVPGVHRVRIERDGYRPWENTVEVFSTERSRVAGSLDVIQRQ